MVLTIAIKSLDDLIRPIREHIKALADKKYLLDYCTEFVMKETRDATYIWAVRTLQQNSSSTVYSDVGDRFLHDWNRAYYGDPAHQTLDRSLRSDLEKLNTSCSHDFNLLREKRLGSLTDEDIALMTKLFAMFGERRSIAWTGASKMLNVTAPSSFMIWDSWIRDAYHRIHAHKAGGYVECYAEFMKQANDIANKILQNGSEDELSKAHPSYKTMKFKKTLAKMLDEANYMKFSWKR